MNELILLWAHGDPTVTLDLAPALTVAGAAVRFVQAVLEGAPYLLSGVVFSGLLRGVIGGQVIRRRLGSSTPGSVAQASLFGLLLPLGALGALPVARRLLTMGVSRGTTLAFLLSAAVLDPLSLVFGMSLLNPAPLAGCVVALLIWSVASGLLVNWLTADAYQPGEQVFEASPATALARLVRVVSSMTDEFSGPSLRDLALAAGGAGLLGAFLPRGWLEVATAPPHAAGSLVVAAVASLAPETPVEAMRLAGVLVRDGFTYQVAFTLLAFGAGFNLAVLAWLCRGLRLGPGLLAAVAAIGLTAWTLTGWWFDRPRHALPSGQMFHTHAFDELGRPNVSGRGVRQAASSAWTIAAKSGAANLAALVPIAMLFAGGLVARRTRIGTRLAPWIEALGTPRPGSTAHAWERPLSPRWTAALGLSAAVPAVVALVLTYYPAPSVLFDEMVPAHTEVQYAVRLGKVEEALKWIDHWESLVRKLGPSVLLRRGSLDTAARVRHEDLLNAIGALRGFLEERRVEEARTLLGHVSKAQQECRRAFDASG